MSDQEWPPAEVVQDATVKRDADVRLRRPATPPAVRTGEDDGADVERVTQAIWDAGVLGGRAHAERLARAAIAALSARPLVSGTDAALAATTQATVGVLTGHTTGCCCTSCEHLRLVGLPDAVQALVSGTANRDDVARERFARWLWNRREDVVGDFDGEWARDNPLDRDRSLEHADELLALLGGDQDDEPILPAETIEANRRRMAWFTTDEVRAELQRRIRDDDQGDEDGAR